MTRTEKWMVEPDGEGAFNAVFEMYEDGKLHGRGAAKSGVTKAEAEAHCAMARKSNAETAEKLALVDDLFNKQNWKMPTRRFITDDLAKANAIHDALCHFCGGAELIVKRNGTYEVGSLGYYHYVGA